MFLAIRSAPQTPPYSGINELINPITVLIFCQTKRPLGRGLKTMIDLECFGYRLDATYDSYYY